MFVFTPVVLLISWQPSSELSRHQLGDHEPPEHDEYLLAREKIIKYILTGSPHRGFQRGLQKSKVKSLKTLAFLSLKKIEKVMYSRPTKPSL